MTYTEKLAYIAGIFDGESSLYISRTTQQNGKKKFQCAISIAMNDIHGLKIVQEFFGGNIRIGHKKVKDIKTNETYCPAYVISYAAESKVQEILIKVLPYLQVKKEQAEVLLNFIAYKKHKKYGSISSFNAAGMFNNLWIKCKRLKSKNWIIKNKLKL